ncbi:MAG: Beta sliding clamp [Myxococcota bacterium]|nr:Beta sliding clamp [Myxococcota bacterium]
MELTILRKELIFATSRTQTVVEKKSTLPILANVLIEARTSGEITISATDLDTYVSGVYRGKVRKAGALSVSAEALADFARSLPEDVEEVGMTLSDNKKLNLKAGKIVFNLNALSADEFPARPQPEGAKFVEFSPDDMLWMIQRTQYAASTDETRYNLNGVLFHPGKDGAVTMVATDGHRLALTHRALSKSGAWELGDGVILPRKGLNELRKLLEEPRTEGEEVPSIQLGVHSPHVYVQTPNVLLAMRLVEGRFPNYSQVIPANNPKVMILPRTLFEGALRRQTLLNKGKTSNVRLDIEPGNLTVSSSNPEKGDSREEVPMDYEGSALKIGFNARYIMDAIAVMKSERVIFRLNEELSPGLLLEEGSEDYKCVVMPLRI